MSCNDKRVYAEKPCIYKFSCGWEVCMMEECPEYEAKTKKNKYLMSEGCNEYLDELMREFET